MKRNIVILLVILILALLLCSCGKEKENAGVLFNDFTLKDGTLSFSAGGDYDSIKCTISTMYENKKLSTQTVKNEGGLFALDLSKIDAYQIKIDVYNKNEYLGYILMKEEQVLLTPNTYEYIAGLLTNEEIAGLVVGDYDNTVVAGNAGQTRAIERLGVPAMSFADGPQGVRLAESTVWYPSGCLVASTWNKDLVYKVGESLGEDAVATGVDVILGPGMNIQRIVLCGRNYEYFSEDPYLTGITATKYTQGVQSTGTGVSLKHYAFNNQESRRSSISSEVTERAAREIYLKAFQMVCEKANPMTVMSSYNKINGTYASVNESLLGILREDFGFSGLVMSDWGASGSVTNRLTAGNDLSMEGNATQYNEVINGLEKGKISREDAVKACANILKVVTRSTAYKNMLEGKDRGEGEVDYEGNRAVALEAAEEGMVLLKNDGNALPLAKNSSISFTGDTVFGGNGSGGVKPQQTVSIREGLEKEGFSICSDVSLGQSAIIVISRTTSEGEDHTDEEGDFRLNSDEFKLIEETSKACRASGKKLCVILNCANPIEVASWEDKADAILWCGLGGETIGTAVANIISGDVNPSGKLTCTWPIAYCYEPYTGSYPSTGETTNYVEDIYVGYRFNKTFNVDSMYEFGYGLSYTEFEYSDVKISTSGTVVTTSFKVKNIGKVAGKEVAQVYIGKPETETLMQSEMELCGYEKTKLLKPGESQKITIEVDLKDNMTFDEEKGAYVLLEGDYNFYLGQSVDKIVYETSVSFADGTLLKSCEKLAKVRLLERRKQFKILDEGTEFVPDEKIPIELKSAYCSYAESNDYTADKAIDGKMSTRWSGAGKKEKWITVDIGETKVLDAIKIMWESNSAMEYTIKYSDDNENFATFRKIDMNVEDGMVSLEGITARYVKIEIEATSQWGSIYEIYLYE